MIEHKQEAISLFELLEENVKTLNEIGIVVKYTTDVSKFEAAQKSLLFTRRMQVCNYPQTSESHDELLF